MAYKTKDQKKEYQKKYYLKHRDKLLANSTSRNKRIRAIKPTKISMWRNDYTEKERSAMMKLEREEKHLLGNIIEWDFVGNKSHEFLCKMMRIKP